MTIEHTCPDSDEALQLMSELWAELDLLYGNAFKTSYKLDGMGARGAVFIIARDGGVAVGCAALCPMTDDIAEVKRMYVQPAMRRKGVARELLGALENSARDAGFNELWLETGRPQVAAIRLYEQHGYTPIVPYGRYKDDPISLCYAKRLR